MQNRSINVGGSFRGVANTGDNSSIQYTQQESSEQNLAEMLEEILAQLMQRYPDSPLSNRQVVFQMELQQKLKADPTLRDRLLGAVKGGGIELIKVITNNPFVGVPLEMFKGWIEAEARQ